MSELVLCCGKVCSGKSTFARRLEALRSYVRFSADEWMLHLYGETADRALFEDRLARTHELIARTAERILARGVDVVVESGFWKREERRAWRERFEGRGVDVRLVYFPIGEAEQLARLRRRRDDATERHYDLDENAVRILNGMFEEPVGEEFVDANEFARRLGLDAPEGRAPSPQIEASP